MVAPGMPAQLKLRQHKRKVAQHEATWPEQGAGVQHIVAAQQVKRLPAK